MMLKAILELYHKMEELLGKGAELMPILRVEVRKKIDRMKYLENETAETEIGKILQEIEALTPEQLTQ